MVVLNGEGSVMAHWLPQDLNIVLNRGLFKTKRLKLAFPENMSHDWNVAAKWAVYDKQNVIFFLRSTIIHLNIENHFFLLMLWPLLRSSFKELYLIFAFNIGLQTVGLLEGRAK